MVTTRSITAKTAWYDFALGGIEASEITYSNDILTVSDHQGKITRRMRATDITGLTIEEGPLRNGITIDTKKGRPIKIAGLQKKESERIHRALEERLRQLHAEEEKRLNQRATEEAKKLKSQIITLEKNLQECLSGQRFIRHSKAEALARANKNLTDQVNPRVRKQLDQPPQAALARIDSLQDLKNLENSRTEANRRFTTDQTVKVKEATGDLMANPLTDEQAQAVATDEDATLVLAGAGTGKTSVITGKIAHLVRNQGVASESILALAFNREAAQEIRDRLPKDLQGANVLTFHAFGRQVIASQGTAPTVSTMASDAFSLAKTVQRFLADLVNDPDVGNIAIRLMANMPADYKAPFDFKNESEYQRYIREVGLRALSGDLVKSFEELEIANWLTQNGVPFRYERTYPEDTRTREYRQYQPDFWIPGHDIYIEHFALNEKGAAPQGWTGYVEGVQWKRQKHQEKGTTLVETYSWQHRQETLLPTLRQKLEGLGVEFKPISRDQLIAKLGKERISPLCSLLCTFLNHAKSSSLSHEELVRRIDSVSDRKRAKAFIQVFRTIRDCYEARLTEEQALDFHDLINQAAMHLKEKRNGQDYTHVLVDEFQDISTGRMELLKALRNPDVAYFLVGDDWQSIYRFTGSRVSLVRNVSHHLGHTQVETLKQTFRFGKRILEPSSHFIQQNPEQTRRTLEPNPDVDDKGITVVATREAADGLRAVIKDLAESEDYQENDSIMVLGRFRHSRRALHTQGPRARDKVIYRTVHSAKGQEADYVVILDLKDSKHGFPCKVEDDPLLKLVLPPIEDGEYQFAEERRLFYVALTRARKGVYLVVDDRQPSPFARELIKIPGQEVRLINKLMPQCPRCLDGTLRESRSQENLRCSNHPDCRYLSPICPDCKVGFVSISQEGVTECSNLECRTTQTICPSCRQGILVQRARRRDRRPFLGCSGFAEEPSCRYVGR